MNSFWVSDSIIHISTYSSSNDIESFIVIFIHLQLTLGCVVECSRDHVRLLDDLLNSTTLAQEIVTSSVFSATEILAIENDKLYNTFLHVAFETQSLLKPISDQTGSDTN
jgi:L-rhamnose isomerase